MMLTFDIQARQAYSITARNELQSPGSVAVNRS